MTQQSKTTAARFRHADVARHLPAILPGCFSWRPRPLPTVQIVGRASYLKNVVVGHYLCGKEGGMAS